MNPYLLYGSLGLYLVAGILYLMQWVFTRSQPGQAAHKVTWLAWLLQSVLLGIFFSGVGYPFLVNEFSSYLFSAWVVATAFLVIQWRGRFPLLGAFVLPVITIFYLLALFQHSSYSDASALMKNPWASVHLVFSFLALAIFAMSFVLGIMFIIEEFQLKYKVLPKLFLKMPTLDALERVHARALTIGFILLTGGIVSGAGWAKSVTGYYFFEDARQLWAIIAWLIYALFLQSRLVAGWRGRRGVILSLIGFVVVLFTFIGVEHG